MPRARRLDRMQTGSKRRIPGKVVAPIAVVAISAIAASGWLLLRDAPPPLTAAALRVTALDPTPLPPAVPPAESDTGAIELDLSQLDLSLDLDELTPIPGAPEDTAATEAPAEAIAEKVVERAAPPPPPPEDAAALATALPQPTGDGAPPPAEPQLALLPGATGIGGALAPAPDPALIERTPQGPLPRIGDDGRQPWRVYAKPFDANDARPRVAVVLSALGLSNAATEAAIQGLPGGVTLAFQPYADDLQNWIQLARAAGHEVLLHLPMEPVDYPANDPGPQALFTALTPQQNLARLEWALSRVSGYVGVTNHMGSRFTTSRSAMKPVIETLKDRGLLYVDTRASARSVGAALATEIGVPRALNDRFIDTGSVNRQTIDNHLAEAERIALETGLSVVIGQPYPVTLERLGVWLSGLEERGIALAPVSAVVNLQGDR